MVQKEKIGNSVKYRSEIDGLRAIAVIPVILFHAGFSLFSGGYVGVDVFFVISGYLITTILVTELHSENFSILRFYERRARRILPALFIVMLVCLPFSYIWMLPSQLEEFAKSLIAVVTFSSNIFFWLEDGYFAAPTELKPLLHTWSLAVEEQYYLLFPLFLVITWKFGQKRLLWSLVAIAAFSFLMAEWGWRNKPSANFYLAPTRAWELLVGSICALLNFAGTRRKSDGLSLIGLALIVFSIFAYDSNTPFPSIYTVVPVLGTALIILFSVPGTYVARLLSARLFVGIGLISYSAYLWHQPIFAFARLRSLTEPSVYLMSGLTIAVFPLAWLTWYWIELPFRKSKGTLIGTQSGIFLLSLVGFAFFLFIGLSGSIGAGFEWRLSETARQLYSTAIPSPMRGSCHYGRNSRFTADNSCIYLKGKPDVAVYGNSHGVELAYAVSEDLQIYSRSIHHFTISGCLPSFGRQVEDHYCDDFFQDRLNFLLVNEDISFVIITYRADNSGTSGAESMVGLANHLVESGKNVILILQAPTLENSISTYLKQAFITGESDVPSRTRQDWNLINANVYASLAFLRSDVSVIDVADHFCDEEVCYAVRNSTALYFDDNHMSIFGARLVAPSIVELLMEK